MYEKCLLTKPLYLNFQKDRSITIFKNS